ncbi:hypothetical protein EVAR_12552_1 [Eumeta japonica]|uniref:Uncharacterized protein n=1 Tax=Eumeta variegata TaxID=151549 RepID=A0A4C1TPR7_EUMVA|nr:hypothetical protein EVAR_12552_1 [Eumeta japonica]
MLVSGEKPLVEAAGAAGVTANRTVRPVPVRVRSAPPQRPPTDAVALKMPSFIPVEPTETSQFQTDATVAGQQLSNS